MPTDTTTTVNTSLGDIVNGLGNAPAAEPTKGDNANGNPPTPPEAPEMPAWTSQLPEEMRKNADLMKSLSAFQKIGDLAKAYGESSEKNANAIIKPGKDAKPEDLDAYYKALGRPDKADGYTFKGEMSDQIKEIAYKAGLTDEQATAIYNGIGNMGQAVIKTNEAARARQLQETDAALHAEYGNKYGEKMALMQRGILAYGGQGLGQKLQSAGLLLDNDVVHMFVKLGEMTAEADLFSKGAGGGKNGYVSTSDGGTFKFKE